MNGALNQTTYGQTTHRGGGYLLPFLFLLIIAMPHIAFGQEMPGTAITHHLWINIGYGGTSIGPAACLTISDFNITNNTLISAGGFYTEESRPSVWIPEDYEAARPGEALWDARLMIGKSLRERYYFLSASAGLAFTGGTRIETTVHSDSYGIWKSYEKQYYRTVGIPIQAQAHWMPLKFLGIGIDGIININSTHSTYGIFMSGQLGRLYAD
jgi:hypothetical protein